MILKRLIIAIIFVLFRGCTPDLCFAADTVTRDAAINFIIKHEGGYIVYRGVEYNHGLSGKYYGDVKNMPQWKAIEIYKKLWTMTGAEAMPDNTMAFVYFDTAILFCETTAQALLVDCYDFRTYLIRRLHEHLIQIKKCPALKENLQTWVQRTIDLYDKLNH